MLVEIGTQIKFSQNQEDSNAEGIQAVCKSIANVFVKAVVILSMLTILVWAFLIKFDWVTLEKNICSICWIV
jgi:cation transport ATPase